MLNEYEILVHYNVIGKKSEIRIPGLVGCPDNADNSAHAHVVSLATLNGIAVSQVPIYLTAIGNANPYNPVAEWITSKPWDGTDRLQAFYDTLTTKEGFPVDLKETLLYRWLLSAVAAVFMSNGFRCRGVLVLQGIQSLGKTYWVMSLVPDPLLREAVIKLDHHLDAANKDSIITAISHWIVEIGELDSSFKKDVARLKGFTTADRDKVRIPYARGDSNYQRRTVFCARLLFLGRQDMNTSWNLCGSLGR